MFLSAARIGLLAFVLERNRDRIVDECYGGLNDQGYSPQGTMAAFYCNTPFDSLILTFVVGSVIDWVLNGYMYFVVWRYYVKMRLYPETMKNEAFTAEDALDEF
ncbi:hypothetical protein BGZ65_012264 [Modicella reniformis]|uniref:Uncharacterized protein n=1 Tax=Modicella reniformis TaxID=1440133 RepID=A0A9P6MJF0_9FUNG|nr:hypothetical protein BGZ65_012264 [Modicella reniformis]